MKVLVYPKDKNPYQELLYREMRKDGNVVEYLDEGSTSFTRSLFTFFPKLLKKRIEGYSIFHLHWLYTFRSPIHNLLLDNELTRLIFSVYFMIFIAWIRFLGYKIVWTMHNVVPHERIFIHDISVEKILIRLCSRVIVHTESSISLMDALGLSSKKAIIIPIGNYRDTLPLIEENKDTARSIIGVRKEKFTFLFFGMIREYKGLDILLKAFNLLVNSNSQLLIVGDCNDEIISDLIEESVIANPDIKFEKGYLPDKRLSTYLSASDVVVLPYRRVTTSSTAILAMSMGKPIVAPRLPLFEEFPNDTGYFYDPTDSEGLRHALEGAISDKRYFQKVEKVSRFVTKYSWKKVSQKTIELYESLS